LFDIVISFIGLIIEVVLDELKFQKFLENDGSDEKVDIWWKEKAGKDDDADFGHVDR